MTTFVNLDCTPHIANPTPIFHTKRMKVTVSIPVPIFAKAEALAKRLKLSRSRLYARAVAGYVERHTDDEITELANAEADAMAAALPKDDNAAFRRASYRTVLQHTEW